MKVAQQQQDQPKKMRDLLVSYGTKEIPFNEKEAPGAYAQYDPDANRVLLPESWKNLPMTGQVGHIVGHELNHRVATIAENSPKLDSLYQKLVELNKANYQQQNGLDLQAAARNLSGADLGGHSAESTAAHLASYVDPRIEAGHDENLANFGTDQTLVAPRHPEFYKSWANMPVNYDAALLNAQNAKHRGFDLENELNEYVGSYKSKTEPAAQNQPNTIPPTNEYWGSGNLVNETFRKFINESGNGQGPDITQEEQAAIDQAKLYQKILGVVLSAKGQITNGR